MRVLPPTSCWLHFIPFRPHADAAAGVLPVGRRSRAYAFPSHIKLTRLVLYTTFLCSITSLSTPTPSLRICSTFTNLGLESIGIGLPVSSHSVAHDRSQAGNARTLVRARAELTTPEYQ